MGVLWSNKAWEEYINLQGEDKKTIKKINILIKEIIRTPFSGSGNPEPLKGNLSGWWSRHIDEKNRIIYKKMGDDIVIASCKGHYSQK